MLGFSLKMHQIQFRLRLCPDFLVGFGEKGRKSGKGKKGVGLEGGKEGRGRPRHKGFRKYATVTGDPLI